jgi:UDP-N-acetylmuramate--alanine ligase
MKEQYPSIYFLGIAGIGVSALAQLAQARGVHVSGADPAADPGSNPAIHRLLDSGARIYVHHSADNLEPGTSLIVASAAVPPNNPELAEAQRRGIRIVTRAEFLGEIMAAHPGIKIAVAGTHGKTTTTGMLGVLLASAGLDPTVFVGGEVADIGGNLRIGSPGGPFVVEACEAYDSFLSLHPDIAIVTNVEADHLDHYGDEAHVYASFVNFLNGMPAHGTIVACGDDPGVKQVLAAGVGKRTVLEYGMGDAWYSGSRAKHVSLEAVASYDWHAAPPPIRIQLSVAGAHNVLNSLAAATVAKILEIDNSRIARGLAAFHGAQRRMDSLGDALIPGGSVHVIDDYAHHPSEIRAVIGAVRGAYPSRRLIAIFQPHLYSRTRDFLEGFAGALSTADALIVTDVYAAREKPIPGVRAADIVNLAAAKNTTMPALFIPDRMDVPAMLEALAHDGDVALFMGAGNIREQAEMFVRQTGAAR